MSDKDKEIRELREQVRLLTERIFRIERQLGSGTRIEAPPVVPVAAPAVPAESAAPPVASPDTSQPEVAHLGAVPGSTMPSPSAAGQQHGPTSYGLLERAATSRANGGLAGVPAKSESLETRIGSRWLNRIGIVSVLVGVSYFLKYAFENDWFGPSVQVIIGIAAGVAVAAWSERFRRRGFAGFAYSLKAVGAGAIYLSLWAAIALYALVPAAVAFCGMMVVTGAMAALAVFESAEVLAALALVGGFLTPVLVSTGQNQEVALLSYLLLLDVAALLLQHFKSWPRILFGGFVGTELLFVFWYVKFYSDDQFAVTVSFLSAFFALFAAAPLVADLLPPTRGDATPLRTAVVLPVLNGFAYFCTVYAMLAVEGVAVDTRAAQYLLAIAALYAGLGLALDRRASDALPPPKAPTDARLLLPLVHLGMAVSCLTAAIALWLHGHWIAFSWLVEAAALFYAGAKAARPVVKWLGVIVAALAVFNLLIGSVGWRTETLVLNERFGLYLLAIGVIAWMLWWQRGAAPTETAAAEGDKRGGWLRHPQGLVLAAIAINLLALCALNFEVSDYFSRAIQAVNAAYRTLRPGIAARQVRSLMIARDFSYSAVWMAYGVLLMWVGFWKRAEFLRWQAIVLIGFTILKVFIYDASALQRGYRILSFMILGVILLAISFAYQKDWLGLQKSGEG
jgi:uncharacterized membrane protein